jgi:hypothetical protein
MDNKEECDGDVHRIGSLRSLFRLRHTPRLKLVVSIFETASSS